VKLRRIDMIGFKSFRARTALEFSEGVTAVVGPNGCGKSNIVDAIRWCIGSQSAKDLRGRQMEDIIFAGSEQHKPMGLCEVSITLENDGGDLPMEWRDVPEVKVTRRLFRTGESEFEINGAKVRLRDIHELFLGTGVGAKEAYSIIEQGRIGFIIAARPEERRVLIEEAAGITRYKFQRKTAEKRLAQTRENLTRLHDIIGEVARQVSTLERQARRAQQARELGARVRALEVSRWMSKRSAIDASLATLRASIDRDREEIAGRATTHKALEASYEEARIAMAVEERSLAAATEEVYRCRARVEVIENSLQHAEREQARSRDAAATALAERAEASESAAKAADEAIALSEELAALTSEAERLTKHALERAANRDALRAEASEANERRRKAADAWTEAKGKLARATGRAETLQAELLRISERLSASATDNEGAEQTLALARRAESDAAEEVERTAAHQATTDEAYEIARTRERAAMERVAQTQRDLRKASESHESANASARAAAMVLERGEGYDASVQRILEASARGALSGVKRPLVEAIHAEESALGAVSSALGELADALVTESHASARAAIAWCAEHGVAGAFVVMNEPYEGPLGAGGWCVARAPVPGVVRARLADVQLADSIPDGLTDAPVETPLVVRWGRHAYRGDGLYVSPPSGANAATAWQGLRERADETRTAAANAQEALRVASTEHATNEQALEAALVERAARREEHERALARSSDARTIHAEQREALRRAVARHEQASLDRSAWSARQSALQTELESLHAARIEAEREGASGATEVQDAEKKADELDAAAREATDAAAHAQTDAVRAQERVSALQGALARLEAERVAALQRAERREAEVAALQATAESSGEKLATYRADLDAAKETFNEARDVQARRHAGHEGAVARVRDLEASRAEERAVLDAARERMRQSELRAERARAELEHIDETLRSVHGVEPKDAEGIVLDGGFTEARAEELDTLTQRLRALGPVNPAAEEEYAEVLERESFLATQRADLEHALHDLESAIRTMDNTSRELFADTFEKVSAAFEDLFPRLFRGGKGRLELTQPDDLLETGIDIVVQPPGKRLQSMTLLSGGEKALTAAALIFAIFRLKPTPFCILDEVDAPLDEGNVARFADHVVEMSATSQFVIITHNKRTMEAATTLYGVTMEEPGVSKIVGVRMQQAG